MRYQSTQDTSNFVPELYDHDFDSLKADSFGEFARAFLLGLGAILLISAGTFLIFSGVVATLVGMVS